MLFYDKEETQVSSKAPQPMVCGIFMPGYAVRGSAANSKTFKFENILDWSDLLWKLLRTWR
jgi:hypothetical protein